MFRTLVMTAVKSIFPVLLILILSSWAGAVSALSDNSHYADNLILNDDEKVSKWGKLSSAVKSDYSMNDFSGIIHSPFGNFDPLLEPCLLYTSDAADE